MDALPSFAIAAATILVLCRIGGRLAPLVSQPQVIGELLVGIALGPTVLGAALPQVERTLFPPSIMPPLEWSANAGLALYVFLIASQVDIPTLGTLVPQAARFGAATTVAAFAAGGAAAALCSRLAPAGVSFAALALFLGAAFAITAVPVLVRILDDHPFVERRLGVLALAVAVVGDVVSWIAVAVGTAVHRGGGLGLGARLALTIGCGVLTVVVLRRLLLRLAACAHVRLAAIGTLALAVALAFATQVGGLTVLVGALAVGVTLPRGTSLAAAVGMHLRRLGTPLLLPLTFAYTGLHTSLDVFTGAHAGLLALVVVLAPVASKLASVLATAASLRYSMLDSLTLGALLNARGVTELVILNLGLAEGVLSVPIFTALVLMTLLTTLLAGPLLVAGERLRHPRPRALALPASARTRVER